MYSQKEGSVPPDLTQTPSTCITAKQQQLAKQNTDEPLRENTFSNTPLNHPQAEGLFPVSRVGRITHLPNPFGAEHDVPQLHLLETVIQQPGQFSQG